MNLAPWGGAGGWAANALRLRRVGRKKINSRIVRCTRKRSNFASIRVPQRKGRDRKNQDNPGSEEKSGATGCCLHVNDKPS